MTLKNMVSVKVARCANCREMAVDEPLLINEQVICMKCLARNPVRYTSWMTTEQLEGVKYSNTQLRNWTAQAIQSIALGRLPLSYGVDPSISPFVRESAKALLRRRDGLTPQMHDTPRDLEALQRTLDQGSPFDA